MTYSHHNPSACVAAPCEAPHSAGLLHQRLVRLPSRRCPEFIEGCCAKVVHEKCSNRPGSRNTNSWALLQENYFSLQYTSQAGQREWPPPGPSGNRIQRFFLHVVGCAERMRPTIFCTRDGGGDDEAERCVNSSRVILPIPPKFLITLFASNNPNWANFLVCPACRRCLPAEGCASCKCTCLPKVAVRPGRWLQVHLPVL